MARVSDTKKSLSNIDKIREFLPDYDNTLDELNTEISDLNSELKSLTKEIESTEKELKAKLKNIEDSRADIKKNIKNSEDFDSNVLTEAASKLEDLSRQENDIERDAEIKKDDYTKTFNELKDNLTIRTSLKEKLESMRMDAFKEMNEISIKYEDIFSKIETAISVCDNDKLNSALLEEKEKMASILLEIKRDEDKKILDEIRVIKPNVEIKEEIVEEDTEEDDNEIKTVDISSILDNPVEFEEERVEIEMPEPVKEIKIEEEITAEPIDFDLADREVIQRDNVSDIKVEQIKNSNIIEDAVNEFFTKLI